MPASLIKLSQRQYSHRGLAGPSSGHFSSIFCPWGLKKVLDVYSLRVDLVFIYLSITVFILSPCLYLAPCCLPQVSLQPQPVSHTAWALLLLQKVLLGVKSQDSMMLRMYSWAEEAHQDMTQQPHSGTGFLDPWQRKSHLTPSNRDQNSGVGLLLSQMGALLVLSLWGTDRD